MEKLMMQRENAYAGYGGSPKTPESEGTDFNDVFGGPPRRFSMQEVRERYSFGESSEEAAAGASSPWGEKPVFGEESTPRRRQKGADFFDDIFKGSPRRSERESSVFGSSPGSRIMSPKRPFSPKPDPLISSSSIPAQFSLPAKLTKAMDLPTFGSNNHGQHKVDGGGNGLSSSPYSSSPFSRFSNEASRSLDVTIRHEVPSVGRQRPLSDEGEDSPYNAISDQEEIIGNSNKDVRNVGNIDNQFHFSIYKWAGRGVPMLMPLVIKNNLKSKDGAIFEKSASSSGRVESKSLRSEDVRSKRDRKQEQNYAAEVFHELSEQKPQSRPNESVVSNRSVKEEQVKPVDGSNVGEIIEKDVHVKRSGDLNFKSEVKKPLHAFLDEGDQPGDVAETNNKKAEAPVVHGDAHDNKVKETGKQGLDSKIAKVETSNLQGQGNSASAKGKVKEFVHIFNQDTDSKLKGDGKRSQRWGNVDVDKKGNEVSSNQEKVKVQVKLHNVDKKPDVSFKVVENLKNIEARVSPRRTSSSIRSSSRLRKSFSADILHEELKILPENLDDPLDDNFEVHELYDGGEHFAENESSEETKALDAKIRQWSVGKKGNIRSLLSTLQYILWPESGWKAVPLVDLIESNSVKKTYQKALLRLHPDKLQQKGAAFHQKYIAEKVFDILQEAWDHFNTSSSLGL